MNTKTLNLTRLALLPAAWLAFTSCSSGPSSPKAETTSAAVFQEGVPGGIVVETRKITAMVTAIDAGKRKVVLQTPDGKKTTVKCGPEVVNFDQIRVGDQLKAVVTEELAVYMATAAPSSSDGTAAVVALAPKGAKPGGIIAETIQITAKVTAIDLEHHKATIQFADGTTRTIAVRKDVDLTQRKVGEEVVIRSTEVFAISVDKP